MPNPCANPGRMQNAECRMQNAERRVQRAGSEAVFRATSGYSANPVTSRRCCAGGAGYVPGYQFQNAVVIFTLIITVLLSGMAHAQIYWNVADGKWEDATNWNPQRLPTSSDTVYIDNNGIAQVDFATGTAQSEYLFVGSSSGTGTLLVTDGGKITTSFQANINNFGTIRIADSDSELIVGGYLYIGSGSTGTLELTNGGKASGYQLLLGYISGSTGIVTVGSGSELKCTGTNSTTGFFGIGWSGTGELYLSDGGKATSENRIYIGGGGLYSGTGSGKGTVTVGSGSVLESKSGDIIVGSYGTGKLTLEDGGKAVAAGSVLLGSYAGSSGTVMVSGKDSKGNVSELKTTSGSLSVGNGGDSTLTLTDGSKATIASNISIGGIGGIGIVMVDTDSILESTNGNLNVGNGTLTLIDGGKATLATGITIGSQTDSSGTVTVGTDSVLQSGGTHIVGEYGTGTLELKDGGKATSANSIYIGNSANSNGTVTVGSGSVLENKSGNLVVGNFGTGTLTVTNGGKATSASDIYVGYTNSGNGTVTVTGTGSVLHNTSGTLTVGSYGTGTLELKDGGKATIASYIYVGYYNTGNGTVTLTDGGTLTSANSIYIGGVYTSHKGTGTVTVGKDSVMENTSGELRVGNSGAGKLELEDGGKATIASNIFVGYANTGNGTVTLTNGGTLTSANHIYIGGYDTSNKGTGTVTVSGTGSELKNTNANTTLTVGNYGTGTLTVENGGTATSENEIFVGRYAGSTGTVTVTGKDSVLENKSANFNVGNYGAGTLTVKDGGLVTSDGHIMIGNYSGSTGTVTVSGKDSVMENIHGALTVGNQGTGTLTVKDGGKATTAGSIFVGYANNSKGTVIVTDGGTLTAASSIDIGGFNTGNRGTGTVTVGKDSVMKNTLGDLNVGKYGTGTLTLINGGKAISASHIYLGHFAGSNGTVTVGNGSTLTSTTGNVYVGGDNSSAQGTGLLAGTGTIFANGVGGKVVVYSNTGTLSAGDNIGRAGLLKTAGSIGTLNIAGNLDMKNNSTLAVDYSPTGIDLIDVTGAATFGDTLKVAFSTLAGIEAVSGKVIVTTTGGITTSSLTGAPIGIFTINGLSLENSRADISDLLLVLDRDNKDLRFGTIRNVDNLFVTWTGDTNNDWEISKYNWTNDDDGMDVKFLDGDAVTFNMNVTPTTTVTIDGFQKTVAQMTVNGNADLTITGNIYCDNDPRLTSLADKTDGSLKKNGTGKLKLDGISVFTGGVMLRGGTLEVTKSIESPLLEMLGGTTFINSAATSESIDFSQFDLHGTANWTGDFNMANKAMNFYVPPAMGNEGVMLRVTGEANVADSTVHVGVEGASSPLKPGDHIVLIDATTLTGMPGHETANASGMHGVTLRYNFLLERMGEQLWATLLEPELNPQTKDFSKGFLVGMSLLNQGADLVSRHGMDSAVCAAKEKKRGCCGIFFDMTGGRSRYDTGSHVDLSSVSLITGVSKSGKFLNGQLTFGAFLEHGNGSYDTYNSFIDAESVRGNGNLRYIGGGVLGRLDFHRIGAGHLYTEASFRAGGITNGYHNADIRDFFDNAASYDSSTAYYGFHVGGGKLWNFADRGTLDLYTKYLWTGLQKDSVMLSTDERVDFHRVSSHRLRLGGRYTDNTYTYFKPYCGGAWEYEFNGDACGTTHGHAIGVPTLRGSTGIAEVGIAWKSTASRTAARGLYADLGVQGYGGKREGVAATLTVGKVF